MEPIVPDESEKGQAEKPEHSPLPWRMSLAEKGTPILRDARGRVLAYMVGEIGLLRQEEIANAEFAARAVNSHADLLAAAKKIVLWNGYLNHPRSIIPAWDALVEAVAKAEGRAK